ncbi:MAG: hypothetical protein WC855_06205 [Thermodesulfovibrionales bacterium]
MKRFVFARSGDPSLVIARDGVPKQSQFGAGSAILKNEIAAPLARNDNSG